jgi:hypothetical protein
LESIKEQCRMNLDIDDTEPCISIPIVLPNSHRIQCKLPTSSSAKVLLVYTQITLLIGCWLVVDWFQRLYEFVLATTDVCYPFLLYTRLGHIMVNMNDTTLPALVCSSILVVEESNDKDNFCKFFSQVCKLINAIYIYWVSDHLLVLDWQLPNALAELQWLETTTGEYGS